VEQCQVIIGVVQNTVDVEKGIAQLIGFVKKKHFSNPKYKAYDATPECTKEIAGSNENNSALKNQSTTKLKAPQGVLNKNLPLDCGPISISNSCGPYFGRCKVGYCTKEEACS